MIKKANRCIDPQGRILIPSHIREALNIKPGKNMDITLTDAGTIEIRPQEERCIICGGSDEKSPDFLLHITIGSIENCKICRYCAEKISRAINK